jgi:hypothetical protein
MKTRKPKTLSLSLLLFAAAAPILAGQASSDAEAKAATIISLASQTIDVSRPVPEPPAALRAEPARPGEEEIVLVKFPGPVTARQAEELRAASLRVYTYLPYYTWLVKMPAGAAAKPLLASIGASWSGPFHPAYKISREISDISEPRETVDRSLEAPRPVMVDVFPDADLDSVVRTMRDLGARDVAGFRKGSFFSRVRLLLTPSEIAALRDSLAAMRDVFWIALEPRKSLLNDTTIWVGQNGLAVSKATPVFDHGIFGEGQTVAILDTGLDADACFFRDFGPGLPVTNLCDGGTAVDTTHRKVAAVDFLWQHDCDGGINRKEWDTFGHGTHVAGTVAGDNIAHPLIHDPADGMAPGARLVIQDAGVHEDPCADLPGLGCPVVDLKPLFQQAYNQGARLHTNSWGDNEEAEVQNNYTAASQDVDQFQWDHKDDLIFFAAGNSGPRRGTVGSPSTNKNGVSVGATLRGFRAGAMAGFSSCGPTADGRIKPDVTLPGTDIVSAGSDDRITSHNCGISIATGTSTSSPAAAGLTALIRQYYMDGWYPTGSRNRADGFTPSAALLKATLVSSAAGMERARPIPDRCQGWGRVRLESALYFTGQARRLWVKDDAPPFPAGSSGEERTYSFTAGGGEPLKATLVWTDYPSTPAASPNLNNDLDLIVKGPGGTFAGNVFSSGFSTPGGEADRRNTVEQVLIDNPPPGVYTITIRSWNVPNGPQPFALVVTGI